MNEFEKKAAELSKEVAGDIVLPTSKSIGINLGLMVDGAMGWLALWGQKQKIIQEKYLEDFKNKVNNKIGNIPPENLIEPPVSVVGPVIEAGKFHYEEIHYREMFSNLLASACDKKHSQTIHPAFVEILKQLSPLDAKLLSMFRSHTTYALCDVQEKLAGGMISPFIHSLFDFKEKQNEFSLDEILSLTSSLDNLIRLGIVSKNRSILESNYNYEMLKNNTLYKDVYEKMKKPDSVLEMKRARIELTDFGRKFNECCLPSEK